MNADIPFHLLLAGQIISGWFVPFTFFMLWVGGIVVREGKEALKRNDEFKRKYDQFRSDEGIARARGRGSSYKRNLGERFRWSAEIWTPIRSKQSEQLEVATTYQGGATRRSELHTAFTVERGEPYQRVINGHCRSYLRGAR